MVLTLLTSAFNVGIGFFSYFAFYSNFNIFFLLILHSILISDKCYIPF